jgi:cystathionine beta-synthase
MESIQEVQEISNKSNRNHINLNSNLHSDSRYLNNLKFNLNVTYSIKRKKIYTDVMDLISNSPIVRLNKIPKSEGIKCEVLAKCEYLLPGGSCKDRVAKKMIEDAEKKGLLIPGVSTIIEPSSGNTGIGIAMVSAVKGYNVIITLPDKMSQEKEDILNSLGATVVRTSSDHHDDPNSHFAIAQKLAKEIPNSIILDQYANPSNIQIHYEETAEELWEQCDGRIDYVVLGVGTGGTISGVGRKLKEKNPNIQIIGVDPHGSVIAPEELNIEGNHRFQVEGIGYDYVPKNCDKSVIDQWIKVNDKESFRMARRLIKEEGLLIGGSCGSAMVGAMKIAKDLPEDKRVLVFLVDGIRNYISKYLNDDWMLEHEYISVDEYVELQKTSDNIKPYGSEFTISELNLMKVTPVRSSCTVNEVLEEFTKQDIECLPVVDDGKVKGVISYKTIANALSHYKINFNKSIEKIVNEEFRKLRTIDYVRHLQKAFIRHKYVVVLGEDESYFICEPKHIVEHFMSNKNK